MELETNDNVADNAGPTTEEDFSGIDMIESMCMSCGDNGMTRLLIHKIPFFRELIIASFQCEHCGYTNNEVTFGGAIQPKGCIYELEARVAKDLDRQLIKSDSATIRIPEIDFEIPPGTQKGGISTLEGFLMTAAKNLGLYQSERLAQSPGVGAKVAEIIYSLQSMAMGRLLPFHIIVDDPAGNAFIENFLAPQRDPQLRTYNYSRTKVQDVSLGLQPEDSSYQEDETNYEALVHHKFGATQIAQNILDDKEVSTTTSSASTTTTTTSTSTSLDVDPSLAVDPDLTSTSTADVKKEVIKFPNYCPNCSHAGESMMAVTSIPHFKEIIIMAFTCNFCGFRNSEVKGGGAVPTKGTQVTVRLTAAEDLRRDVLKSDTCAVLIPELELELGQGSLGGVFTTVEGLLIKIHTTLEKNNPFALGDAGRLHHSQSPEAEQTRLRMGIFLSELKAAAAGELFPLTLVLRDPLGNSFVSCRLGDEIPPEQDTSLLIEDFDRTFEENEDFGLNDINTKDFEVVTASTSTNNSTGETDETDVILPDRVTHVVLKGADHPTVYAKGTPDATPGGIFWGNSKKTDNQATSGDEDPTPDSSGSTSDFTSETMYYVPPPGWVALKPGQE